MTDNKWVKRKINDVCLDIHNGGTPSRKRPEYYKNGAIVWVKSKELQDGPVYDSEEKITNKALSESSARMFPANTILMAMYGATVGQLGILKKEASTNQAICGMIANEDIIDHKFLFYSLLNYRDSLISQAFGAAQQNINQEMIRDFEISVPPLELQKEVAGVLSLFDDLIEVNVRRIEVLEEIIHSLYGEWFVHLRYPGHNDTETTQPPNRWETKSASETIFIDPKIRVPKNTEKKYVPMSSLSTHSMVIKNVEARKGSSGSKFQNQDTLFARITPSLEHGKTGFVQFLNGNEIGIGSTEFIVLRSKTLTPEFVYCMARSDGFRNHAIKSMIGASGRQRVRKECFDNFYFAHPPKSLLNKFSLITSPMFKEIQLLVRKNEILKQTQELLMPNLISGGIDLKKQFSEVTNDGVL